MYINVKVSRNCGPVMRTKGNEHFIHPISKDVTSYRNKQIYKIISAKNIAIIHYKFL